MARRATSDGPFGGGTCARTENAEHGRESSEQDPEIRRKRDVATIREIELQFVAHDFVDIKLHAIGRICEQAFFVDVADGCGPRDARLDLEDLAFFCRIFSDKFGQFRTRSYQTHRSLKDVEELRHLVELRSPQNFSDFGDSVISRSGEPRSLAIGIRTHRAQLHDLKGLAVASDSELAIENRAARLDPDRCRADEQNWSRNQQSHCGRDNVEQTFAATNVQRTGGTRAAIRNRGSRYRFS